MVLGENDDQHQTLLLGFDGQLRGSRHDGVYSVGDVSFGFPASLPRAARPWLAPVPHDPARERLVIELAGEPGGGLIASPRLVLELAEVGAEQDPADAGAGHEVTRAGSAWTSGNGERAVD